MKIETRGVFGTVTWNFSPEYEQDWREQFRAIDKVCGVDSSDDMERECIAQVQDLFGKVIASSMGAVYMPGLMLVLLSMANESMCHSMGEQLELIRASRENG